MKTRLDLRNTLLEILVRLGIRERDGDGHLYFQPPPNVRMKYPAIVYEMSGVYARNADNRTYLSRKQYTVTAIDKDPDSGLPDELAAISTARMSRFFTSDNLNHWVFSMYL